MTTEKTLAIAFGAASLFFVYAVVFWVPSTRFACKFLIACVKTL